MSDSLFLIYLPHVGTALSLALLFVFTAIWLKSTVRGFGLMALAEVLDLVSRALTALIAGTGLGMGYEYTPIFWVVGGIVRLVGAYLLYKHYLDPEADSADGSESSAASK